MRLKYKINASVSHETQNQLNMALLYIIFLPVKSKTILRLLLSSHVRISELISTLQLPECQETGAIPEV